MKPNIKNKNLFEAIRNHFTKLILAFKNNVKKTGKL